MVPKVNAQQKCFVVLNPNGCGLETCGKECFQQHNGNGVCEMSSFGKGQNLHTLHFSLISTMQQRRLGAVLSGWVWGDSENSEVGDRGSRSGLENSNRFRL
uniref:Uncharacterized protein n=1 Tax=Fagus sylvatica TaxID=28930 RepID=A0A2N9E933_FAGSY